MTSPSEDSTSTTATTPKIVRFDDSVEVQEHPILLGTNPGGATGGPPITIGWDVLSRETMSLEACERTRRPLVRKSRQERTNLLSSLGFDSDEMLDAELIADKIRSNRIDSSEDSSEQFSPSSSFPPLAFEFPTELTATSTTNDPPSQPIETTLVAGSTINTINVSSREQERRCWWWW